MYFQKIIVYKIPPGGEGVYSQLKALKYRYNVTVIYVTLDVLLFNAVLSLDTGLPKYLL